MTDIGTEHVNRARAAVEWFNSREISTIRVHYPQSLPSTVPLGKCSCGKAYKLDGDGKPVDAMGLCISPGKHPVDRDWARGRLAKPDDFDLPYNVGLMCGPEHSLMVLDVDVRNGGLETMSKLAPTVHDGPHGWELSDTFSYFTSGHNGSRGYHLLFRPTDEAWDPLLRVKSPHGIDFKMSGMVVAVPSLHASGARYEFRSGDKAVRELTAEDAQQLATALGTMVRAAPETAASSASWSPGEATETVKRWLMGYDCGTLGEGERNNGMLPLIGALCRLSMDGSTVSTDVALLKQLRDDLTRDHKAVPTGIWTTARAMNGDLCRPPMPDEELGTMTHNVFRSEVEKQIGALEGVKGMLTSAPARQAAAEMTMSHDLKAAIWDRV